MFLKPLISTYILHSDTHTHTKTIILPTKRYKRATLRYECTMAVWCMAWRGFSISQRNQAKIDGFLTKIKHRSETKYNSSDNLLWRRKTNERMKWKHTRTHIHIHKCAWLRLTFYIMNKHCVCAHIYSHSKNIKLCCFYSRTT